MLAIIINLSLPERILSKSKPCMSNILKIGSQLYAIFRFNSNLIGIVTVEPGSNPANFFPTMVVDTSVCLLFLLRMQIKRLVYRLIKVIGFVAANANPPTIIKNWLYRAKPRYII